jgi:hypothetical protein
MYLRSLSILHISVKKETWAICFEKGREMKKRELEKMMKREREREEKSVEQKKERKDEHQR